MEDKRFEDEQKIIDKLTGMYRRKTIEESNEEYIRKIVEEQIKEYKSEDEMDEIKEIKNGSNIEEVVETKVNIVEDKTKISKQMKRKIKRMKIKIIRFTIAKSEKVKNYIKEKKGDMKKIFVYLFSMCVAMSLLAVPVMIGFEQVMYFMAKERFTPPGKVVALSDKKIHINRMGTGEKVILLEADIGMNSFELYSLQKELAKYATVITYDRLGYGWSSKDKNERDLDDWVHDLNAVLEEEGVNEPITIISYRYGANLSEYFYKKYKEKVEKMILIDPIPTKFFDESRNIQQNIHIEEKIKNDYKINEYLSYIGYHRFLSEEINDVPEDLKEVKKEIGLVSKVFQTSQKELDLIINEKNKLERLYYEVPLTLILFDKEEDYTKYGYGKEDERKLNELKVNLQSEYMMKSEESEIVVLEKKKEYLDGRNEELVGVILNSIEK